jgi:diguanylate cyclase (GGDEF)-like protein
MTFGENMRMLAGSRHEARTDELTELGNRRRLFDDLDRVLADRDARLVFVLYDLNGFKQYNDSFGHPAGDALLTRLGENLGQFVAGHGNAYRMGGDEFCVVLERGDDPIERVVDAGARALEEHGDGFAITAAYGAVLLPDEATNASEALRLADQRMYAQKTGDRQTAGEQTSGVLLRALFERHPALGRHVSGVAELAESLAIELGLEPGEVARTRVAGALHDIGKMAIPDEILEKAQPLTDREQIFVRRHTLVGERILLAAPALSHIAGLVRSSHERFDGLGYPDGLAGTDIPLPSRIIPVCDAFEAMTASRPYAPARTEAEALDELRRGAGTHFDPEIVEAFVNLIATRQAAPAIALAS